MPKLFILALLICLISGSHVLKNFQEDIRNIKMHYSRGDTSQVFSIFMKMYVQTHALYQHMQFNKPTFQHKTQQKCINILQGLIRLVDAPRWIQTYQEIYQRLSLLHQTCTNTDFVGIASEMDKDNGGGTNCAICTVMVRVMEQYAVYHRKDIAKVIEDQFCSKFDGLVKPTCEAFTHYIGPHIIRGVVAKQGPDVICHRAGICTDKKCKIVKNQGQKEQNLSFQQRILMQTRKPSPWKWLVDLFTKRFADEHKPVFDYDDDWFSDVSTFRGYDWRGADCNQLDNKVYPGRKNGKKAHDFDCNGIYGQDAKGNSLEERLCGNSTRLGVGVIGDSAGAHFSIPQKFLNVSMMHQGTFKDLLPRLADQFDIPQQSAYTAHKTTTYPTHSIYKKLRTWNLCNNNDFQNLGVNGGDSGNTWGNIKALKRDQKNDHPMLMFMELVGNDVCSRGELISPIKFKQNILKLLGWLDTTLPKGSHLVILGLADGDLLFKYLHGTTHPLNVTYEVVYDFLNCLDISPCPGWLNTNASIRQKTTKAAKALSQIYKEIISQGTTYKNFDIQYFDFPTQQIFQRMYLQNKEPSDMIQRCDGFHPSGLFNSYLADWLWFKIITLHPEWIGDQNPNNAEIKKLFGLKDMI